MQGDRVVNGIADAGPRQGFGRLIPPGRADRVLMVDVPPVRIVRRSPDDAGQLSRITRRHPPPSVVVRLDPFELHAKDRRLDLVQTAVVAEDLVHIPLAAPVVPQDPEPPGESLIVRRHHPAVAIGAQVLGRIEGERPRQAERPRLLPLPGGAESLGAVLDQNDSALPGHLGKRLHRRGPAEDMYGDDRLRPGRDPRRGLNGIEIHRLVFHVGEDRRRPEKRDDLRRREERERRRDDLVPRTHAGGPERQEQSVRSRRDADGVPDPVVRRDLILQGLHVGTEDEARRRENVPDRRKKLRLQVPDLGLEINHRNRHKFLRNSQWSLVTGQWLLVNGYWSMVRITIIYD